MAVANPLAYYDTAKITSVKRFYCAGPKSMLIFSLASVIVELLAIRENYCYIKAPE